MEETTNESLPELIKQRESIDAQIKQLIEKKADQFSVYMHVDDVYEDLNDRFNGVSDERFDKMVAAAKDALYEIECVFKYNTDTKTYVLQRIESCDKKIFVNSDLIDIT